MKKAAYLIVLTVLFSLFSYLLKKMLENAGLPNFPSYLRDVLIFSLFAWLAYRTPLLFNRRIFLSIGLLAVLFAVYLLSATLASQFMVGLYYVRIYLVPFLFFMLCIGVFSYISSADLQRVIRWVVYLNLFILVTASILYALILQSPVAHGFFLGYGQLATAWHLAGANTLRMGLPLTSPNNLGVYIALTNCLLLSLILLPKNSFLFSTDTAQPLLSKNIPVVFLWLLVALNLIILLLTFSRSALLLFLLTALFFMFIPRVLSWRVLRVAGLALLMGIFVLPLVLWAANILSDYALEKWFYLNTSGTDPSLDGHSDSIAAAIQDFPIYALKGYPHGTVGPKADLFSLITHNVENSLLSLWFDLGVFGVLAYVFAYGLLLNVGYKHRFQLPILLGFLLIMQALPYVFEPELMMYFMFIYILIGHVATRSQPRLSKA